MTVAEIFRGISRRKVETKVSTFKQYRKLLIDVVGEKAIDDHEAEVVLDQHEVSRDQFEADVEIMRKRLHEHGQIEQAKDAEATRAKAEAEIADILNQRQALHLKTQPKLEAAEHERDNANNLLMRKQTAIRTLQSCVIDPEVIEREKDLNEQRKEPGKKRSGLITDINGNEKGTAAWGLNHNRKMVEEWKTSLAGGGNSERIEYCKRQLQEHQAAAKTFQERVAAATSRLREIDQVIEELDRESKKLNQSKLIP